MIKSPGMGDSPEKCRKCDALLDTENPPYWCRKCRAEYQRDYAAGKLKRAEARGFAAGVEAFRELLITEFDRLRISGFEGGEVAALIQQAPGPSRPKNQLQQDAGD
jgi:hypothetical protein